MSPVEIAATLATGLFAGAAIYINAVEHPARLSCGNAVALRQFAPSYRRATIMQASLAVLGGVAGVSAWWQSGATGFLLGGLTIAAVVPFTLLVILPTNVRLLAADLDPGSAEATVLLQRWGRLHGVRSVAGLVAFLLMTASL